MSVTMIVSVLALVPWKTGNNNFSFQVAQGTKASTAAVSVEFLL
jgi:hypothetical protein